MRVHTVYCVSFEYDGESMFFEYNNPGEMFDQFNFAKDHGAINVTAYSMELDEYGDMVNDSILHGSHKGY